MSATIPHVDQYFGPWLILPDALQQGVEQLQGREVTDHLAIASVAPAARSRFGGDSFRRVGAAGGVALVQLVGPLTKYGASFGGTSTIDARRQIRLAAADESIRGILLAIESPGGTSAGTKELADEVAAAAAVKSTVVYIEDLGASAAYWVASQSRQIWANGPAMIGSIGTYAIVEDSSGMASKIGVKVHVLKAGEHKGAGTPGTEVTSEHLAEWQRIVNQTNDFFLAAVAKGRRLSVGRVRDLADGRIHLAADAQRLGLIDGIGTFDEVLSRLDSEPARQTSSSSSRSRKDAPMSDTSATLQELRAALPGATSDFLLAMLDRGASIVSAQQDFIAQQQRELASREPKPATARRPGAEPLREHSVAGGDAGGSGSDFGSLVAEKMAAGMTRRAAIVAAAHESPEAHAAYVEECNR